MGRIEYLFLMIALSTLLSTSSCRHSASHSLSLTDSLLAYYPFNGNARDSSGKNHHGFVTGPLLTTDKDNQALQAYDFNGKNDIIEISDIVLGPTVTISAWFNFRTLNGYTTLTSSYYNFKRLTSTSYEICLTPDATLGGFTGCATNLRYLFSSTKLCPNRWYHAVLEVDNLKIFTLYIDGFRDTTMNITALTYVRNERPITIGANPENGSSILGPGQFFDGKIDEVRYYNRLLTESEIRALANFSESTPREKSDCN